MKTLWHRNVRHMQCVSLSILFDMTIPIESNASRSSFSIRFISIERTRETETITNDLMENALEISIKEELINFMLILKIFHNVPILFQCE